MQGAMRRPVLRILLNAARVLSLVLCLAIVVFRVRSYWSTDFVLRSCTRRTETGVESRQVGLMSEHGRATIYFRQIRCSQTASSDILRNAVSDFLSKVADSTGEKAVWTYGKLAGSSTTIHVEPHDASTWWLDEPDVAAWGPLRWRSRGLQSGFLTDEIKVAGLSEWAAVGLFAILPTAVGLWKWKRNAGRRRAWANRGRCRKCGYDLRATPDRCPECGTPVAAG
jgi:hypothetical protein